MMFCWFYQFCLDLKGLWLYRLITVKVLYVVYVKLKFCQEYLKCKCKCEYEVLSPFGGVDYTAGEA